MKIQTMRTSVALAVLALSLGAGGCKKQSAEGETKGASAEAKAGEAAKAGAGGCKELADKLCTETGSESMTCNNSRSSFELLGDKVCAVALADFAGIKQRLGERGAKCDELVKKLCEGLGTETETCKMVTEKTKQFPPEQCVAMLAGFDDVLKELKAQEAQNQPLTPEQQQLIGAADAPSFGPADAKVTVVEFSDFECPYCSRAATVANQVKEKYGDRVRFVFRQFPLSFHHNAQGASEAALAAHSQGKFWEFHDKIFQNQRALDRATFEGYAKELGLDLTKFKAELDNKQHEQRVKGDLEIGNAVAVQGTPSMFINGKRIGNPTSFEEVSAAIEAALGS